MWLDDADLPKNRMQEITSEIRRKISSKIDDLIRSTAFKKIGREVDDEELFKRLTTQQNPRWTTILLDDEPMLAITPTEFVHNKNKNTQQQSIEYKFSYKVIMQIHEELLEQAADLLEGLSMEHDGSFTPDNGKSKEWNDRKDEFLEQYRAVRL